MPDVPVTASCMESASKTRASSVHRERALGTLASEADEPPLFIIVPPWSCNSKSQFAVNNTPAFVWERHSPLEPSEKRLTSKPFWMAWRFSMAKCQQICINQTQKSRKHSPAYQWTRQDLGAWALHQGWWKAPALPHAGLKRAGGHRGGLALTTWG